MFILKTVFERMSELAHVLRRWLRLLPTGDAATEMSTAEQVDEISNWKAWGWAKTGVKVSGITGPYAAHSYTLVRRANQAEKLGSFAYEATNVEEGVSGKPAHEDDVVCIIKHHMRDERPAQIVRVLCAHAAIHVDATPAEIVPRKPKESKLVRSLTSVASKLAGMKHISQNAANYLISWVTSASPKKPRPDYPWLHHRWTTPEVVPGVPRAYDAPTRMADMVIDIAPVPHVAAVDIDPIAHGSNNSDDEADEGGYW